MSLFLHHPEAFNSRKYKILMNNLNQNVITELQK